MTDEECVAVYRQLVSMLSDFEMNWVVEEVNEVVRAGKPESSRTGEAGTVPTEDIQLELFDLRTTSSNYIESSSRRISREFTTTRQYTYQERLLLLIDAMELVFVQPAFIEEQVTNFFQREATEYNPSMSPEIIFRSDDEPGQETSFPYVNNSIKVNKVRQANTLLQLLNQLRTEVE